MMLVLSTTYSVRFVWFTDRGILEPDNNGVSTNTNDTSVPTCHTLRYKPWPPVMVGVSISYY